MKTKHTKVNEAGHRWELGQHWRTMSDSTTVYTAQAQKRCTRETRPGSKVASAAYYRYEGPTAEFDTPEARSQFIANMAPETWAK